MIITKDFKYQPDDYEAEQASNSYLMSLIAIMAGLPIPIVNLLATGIFYLQNRKGTYFVRWHVTQALLSQLSLLPVNSFAFWWTISILLQEVAITHNYIAYITVVVIFNIAEFIATIYTAIQTRKGIHVQWFLYGDITEKICRS